MQGKTCLLTCLYDFRCLLISAKNLSVLLFVSSVSNDVRTEMFGSKQLKLENTCKEIKFGSLMK